MPLYIQASHHIFVSILSRESIKHGLPASEKHVNLCPSSRKNLAMGRWMKPEVYPLVGAMTFVCGMVVFQLARNATMNPDVRISKADRKKAVLENAEEGLKYADHSLRKYLRTRTPEIFPRLNDFFSDPEKTT